MGHPPCRQISGLGSKDRPRASSPPHPPRGSHLCRQFAKWQIELYSKGCSRVRRGRMERGLHGDPHGGRAGAGGQWAPSVSAVTNVTRTHVCPGPCPTDVRGHSVCPKPMNPVRRTFDSQRGAWTGAGRLHDAVPCPPASEMGPRSKTCTRQTVQHGHVPGVWVVSGGVRPAGLSPLVVLGSFHAPHIPPCAALTHWGFARRRPSSGLQGGGASPAPFPK